MQPLNDAVSNDAQRSSTSFAARFRQRNLMRSGLPYALALSVAALAAAGPARPATISCADAAVPAEFAICNSESLLVLDERLDAAYARTYTAMENNPDRQKIAREHLGWKLRRDDCKGDVACLALSYQERLADIESATPTVAAGNTPAEPTGLLGFTGQ